MTTGTENGGGLNRLKALWRDGRATFGAIATVPSVQTVQVMARSGYRALVIGFDWSLLQRGIQSILNGIRTER